MMANYLKHAELSKANCVAIPEPHTGFNIAFKMLDIDGNEQVDKKEFEKVKHWLSHCLPFNSSHCNKNIYK